MSKIIATLKYLLLELTPGAILLCILPRGIFEWLAPTALLCPVHHPQQRDDLLFSGIGAKIAVPVPVHGLRNTVVMTIRC